MPSSALMTRWISPVSSSGVRSVMSTAAWSRPRSSTTAAEVGVGRQGAEVAERGELAREVVGGGAHHQAEEGQAALLVEAAGDAEVEQTRCARRA